MAADSDEYSSRPGHDDSRKSDLAVLDANEYKNKRRLERLLDAIDNIPDQADRAREQFNRGEINVHGRRMAVQDAVADAIWEAWNLLKEHEQQCRIEAGKALINRADRLEDSFEPDKWEPADINLSTLREAYNVTGVWPQSEYFTGHPEQRPLGTIPQTNGEDIEIWGLRDFYHLDEQWTETWEEKVKPYDLPARTVERKVNHTVPRDITWAAAIRLKEFLNNQHDMEIQFESIGDELPKWGFKEVEPNAGH